MSPHVAGARCTAMLLQACTTGDASTVCKDVHGAGVGHPHCRCRAQQTANPRPYRHTALRKGCGVVAACAPACFVTTLVMFVDSKASTAYAQQRRPPEIHSVFNICVVHGQQCHNAAAQSPSHVIQRVHIAQTLKQSATSRTDRTCATGHH